MKDIFKALKIRDLQKTASVRKCLCFFLKRFNYPSEKSQFLFFIYF